MTDDKFSELVNLYLDKEISEEDLNLLKSEIAINSDRKRLFLERCRLHKAMRLALKSGRTRSRSSSRSRSRSRRSSSRKSRSRSGTPTRITEADEFAYAASATSFPRWILGSGLAACLLVGFVLLPPVFRDTVDPSSQPELVGVTERDLISEDPLASLSKSELRRFAVIQEQREDEYHASLISQMRLMGLRPEHTPRDKQLRQVDITAVYKPTKRVNQAELFQRIQGIKAMPEPKLLRIEEPYVEVLPSFLEPEGPALVNFLEL